MLCDVDSLPSDDGILVRVKVLGGFHAEGRFPPLFVVLKMDGGEDVTRGHQKLIALAEYVGRQGIQLI